MNTYIELIDRYNHKATLAFLAEASIESVIKFLEDRAFNLYSLRGVSNTEFDKKFGLDFDHEEQDATILKRDSELLNLKLANLTPCIKTAIYFLKMECETLSVSIYSNRCLPLIVDFPEAIFMPINKKETNYDNYEEVWEEQLRYEFDMSAFLNDISYPELIALLRNPSTSESFVEKFLTHATSKDTPFLLEPDHLLAITSSKDKDIAFSIEMLKNIFHILESVEVNSSWERSLRITLQKINYDYLEFLDTPLVNPLETAKRWAEISKYEPSHLPSDFPTTNLVTQSLRTIGNIKSLSRKALLWRKNKTAVSLLESADVRFRFAGYAIVDMTKKEFESALAKDDWRGLIWLMENRSLWAKKWARVRFYEQRYERSYPSSFGILIDNFIEKNYKTTEAEKYFSSRWLRFIALIKK